MQKSVLDLKQRLSQAHALFDRIKALLHFIYQYRIFFGSALIILISVVAAIFFIHFATKEHRDYEIIINNADTDVKLSSEDVLYNKAQEDIAAPQGVVEQKEQSYELILVNSSDTPGVAASLQAKLETKGYTVTDLKSDFEKSKERSVVVYDLALQEEALALSKELGNALLSANPENGTAVPKNYHLYRQ